MSVAERTYSPLGLEEVSDDPRAVRAAFAHFPSGIAAVSAIVDEQMTGLVASSFSVGVSFIPAMVMFSVQNTSTTWPTLRRSPRIGVSVLAHDHTHICYQLASRNGDRFEGVGTVSTPEGALFIDDAALWLDCEIRAEVPAGDHRIVVLEVKSLKTEPARDPLVYHATTFRQLAIR